MPTFAAQLLVVPILLTALLAVVARRVDLGTEATRTFQETHRKLAMRTEIFLDFTMMVTVAGFIIAADQDGGDQALFIRGLFVLATMSVVLSGLACICRSGLVAMVVRMTAFRSILGLGLFTCMLGYLASGL